MRKVVAKKLLMGCGLAVLLAGCAAKGLEQAKKDGGTKLSEAQLEERLEGNTIHVDQYGELADIELFADGSFRAVNHAGLEDKGRWRARNNQLCFDFDEWKHGDIICYTVYQVGEEYRQFSGSGTLLGTFTVTEGNSRPEAAETARRQQTRKPVIEEVPAKEARAETPAPASPSPPPAALDTHAREDIRFINRQLAGNCPGCDLTRIELPGADLIQANLAGADLTAAGLSKANLRRANLRGATLVAADLAGADLGGADLQGADLSRADLTGANLFRANLQGAVLNGAVGVDLEGAIR